MAKKFGIVEPTKNGSSLSSPSDVSSGNSAFSKRGAAVATASDAINNLVALAGDAINTWLMGKMASNASETLCQQLADECLRSQILKTRANNERLAQEITANKSNTVNLGKPLTSSTDGVPCSIVSTSDGAGATYAAHVSDGGNVVEEDEVACNNNST
ncbi:hypothetical protein ACA910_019939 [Epithemia clementina (nom. ined.)]